jgi:hypothetical protein
MRDEITDEYYPTVSEYLRYIIYAELVILVIVGVLYYESVYL